MEEFKGRIGPEGEIVIPEPLRAALGMFPGTEVILSAERNRLILRRPSIKASDFFKKLAERRNVDLEFHPHEAYADELDMRYRANVSRANNMLCMSDSHILLE